MPLTRRHLLTCTAAAACACALPAHAASWPAALKPPALAPKLAPLDRAAVKLAPGPLLDQFTAQRDLYMSLDDDKLLKPFRSRAGQPAPGADMGGWYDDSRDFHIDVNDWSTANWHGYIPGHTFGQYISGLARGYATTHDPAVKAKIAALIDGYAPTITPAFFDGYTIPAYTYDKLAVGLIDAYQYAGIDTAPVLDKLTDAALPWLPDHAETRDERRRRPYTTEAQMWDEPYTLPENLFLAWRLGMGERYGALAIRYLQNGPYFDPLARGESPFKGQHAYSHVNALSSAVQAYYVTGNRKYLDAAKNGFAFLEAQSYATGGWGPNEGLLAPDDTETLYKSLTSTHSSFETPCGAYGHFKITRYLMAITGDSHYGDSMERVLVNTIMGATPTRTDGATFYYSDYNNDATKGMHDKDMAWPCCSGTFIQLTADYGMSAYLTDADGLHVNLYIPSTVTTQLGGQAVTIDQQTAYPLDNTTTLKLTLARPAAFAIALRIPAWAGPQTHIAINGRRDTQAIKPGGFHRLQRIWKDGDVITLALDMGLRLEPLNDAHTDTVAVMTGPLVLFPISGPAATSRAALLTATRHAPDEWRVATGHGDMVLKPFVAITDEKYRLYTETTA